jgi:hypothetical protein
VELNAMTSRQLIDVVERKLQQHGIGMIPGNETLANTYKMFAASDRLSKAFDELKEQFEDEDKEEITVPDDLEAQIKTKLEERPHITWHRAVRLILDPDAPEDNDSEPDDDDDLNDEDLSDIDVEIIRRDVGGHTAWGGFTQWARPYPPDLMLVDPATDPPRNVMLRICSLIAGIVGEQVLDPADYREGSSLDEIIVSQVLAKGLGWRAEYQHVKPKVLWDSCWHRTAMIIRGNQKVARAVIGKLDAFGIVRRKQLGRLTTNIRRLSIDPLDSVIKDDSR